MGVIFQIAVRNLREHKMKTAIICSLIALGMLLLVLGNSIVDTGKVGIRQSFIQSFSGDILVGPMTSKGKNPTMFGSGFQGPDTEQPKTIPDYQKINDYLKSVPGVAVVSPQIYGELMVEIDEDWRAFIGVFGVDPENYANMFPNNIELVSGHFLTPGEEGIMLPEKVYLEVKQKRHTDYKVGAIVQLNRMGSGTHIKQVPVAGIFRFKSPNTSLNKVGFLDLASLRYMMGMVVGASNQIKVDAKATNMMDASSDNLDSFFDSGTVVTGADQGSGKGLSEEKLTHILGDTSQRAAMAKADSGAWLYSLLRVKDGVNAKSAIADLNAHFKQEKSDLVAVDWEGASGEVAQTVTVIQAIFMVLVIIIAIISIFVIMNTMVVSIAERTAEIGTMRALGAQRGYIRGIFITESFFLAIVGGLVGLILASVLLAIMHAVGVPANDSITQLVFGGKILYPVLSWPSAVQAMVIMVLVGLLSSLYPTALAMRISPVKAMQSN